MNRVFLMGRLTKDPETRYLGADNSAKCTFTLAVDRRFNKPGAEKQTDFFNIVAWQKQAEFCGKYLSKGTKVVLSGSIQNRSWDDNEGKKRYVTEIIADEVEFAESKGSGKAVAQETAVGSAPQQDALSEDELPF